MSKEIDSPIKEMRQVYNSKTVEEKLEGYDRISSDSWGEYPLDTVFVRKDQRTVEEIVKRINNNRYQLDPEFQRDFIWTPLLQSRLIESSLMRIPLPVLYVAEDIHGKIIVVDGLQRLTTFTMYLNDKFALKGIDKNPESEIEGRRFSELPIRLQGRIEDTQLTLYILDSKAPERARLDIFERVNSGVPLTRQQMRNCLYSGAATKWLNVAAKSDEFRMVTGDTLNKKTMRDREVVNRFCAFHLLSYRNYKGDMEEFLGLALKQMNEMSEHELDEMHSVFYRTMKLNYELFGKHSFRKSLAETDKNAAKTVLNVSLFDVLTTVISKNIDLFEEMNHNQLKEQIINLVVTPDFSDSITNSTNNEDAVKARHSISTALSRIEEQI